MKKAFDWNTVVFVAIFSILTTNTWANIPPVQPRQGRNPPPNVILWDCSLNDRAIVICYNLKALDNQEWTRCNCSWVREGPLVYEKCEHNVVCDSDFPVFGRQCGKPELQLNCGSCKQNIRFGTEPTIFQYPAYLVSEYLHPSTTADSPTPTSPPPAFEVITMATRAANSYKGLAPGRPFESPDATWTWKPGREGSMKTRPLSQPTDLPAAGNGHDIPSSVKGAQVRIYFPDTLSRSQQQHKLYEGFTLSPILQARFSFYLKSGSPACGVQFLTTAVYMDKVSELGNVSDFMRGHQPSTT